MNISEIPSKQTRIDIQASPEILDRPNISFGMYLPKNILTNEEIESWDVGLSAEKILDKTGVAQRYVAGTNDTPLYMGLMAAQEALKGKRPDVVIVSSSFPQGINLSDRIRNELGFSSADHLDVHAACSGFTWSLSHLKKHEEEFNGKRILLITSEIYSPHLHDLRNGLTKDPSWAQTLFSDGAIATSFVHGQDLKVLSFKNHDFSEKEAGYIKMPIDENLMVPPFIKRSVPFPESGKFEQEGKKILKLIMNNIWPVIDNAVKSANLRPSDIKLIFPHQGSRPVIDAIKRSTTGGFSPESIYEDFKEGNFSSASISKAVMKAKNNGEIREGDKLVWAGFGAGMFASFVIVQV